MTAAMPPRISSMPAMMALLGLTVGASQVSAQEVGPRHHRSARMHRISVAANPPASFRGLTINKPPESAGQPFGDDQDIYQDGPIRYNDIKDFSPAPYVTSGVQFPYGLDGIGGYGSDLGFDAGQDTASYNRGAGSRP